MPTMLIDTKLDTTIDPGQTKHFWWNNASPRNAVWIPQAVAIGTGSTTAGFNEDVSLEVTRVWRRLIVQEIKPYPQSQTADIKTEEEIHYEVKNVGSRKARFTVHLAVVSH